MDLWTDGTTTVQLDDQAHALRVYRDGELTADRESGGD